MKRERGGHGRRKREAERGEDKNVADECQEEGNVERKDEREKET